MGDGDKSTGDGLGGGEVPLLLPPTRGVTNGESIGTDGIGTGKLIREGSRSSSALSGIARRRTGTRCILYESRICSQYNLTIQMKLEMWKKSVEMKRVWVSSFVRANDELEECI